MLPVTRGWILSLLYLSPVVSVSAVATDPLSKIVITSTNATCVKDPARPGSFVFTYQDNVHVTFADQSTVTADALEIVFDGKQKDKPAQVTVVPHKESSLSSFKQIMFKQNVCFTSAHRKATADKANFYLKDQRCVLEGNVKIWQAKASPKDVPITIDSQKAEVQLATGQLKLIGSVQKPVSTTIVLEGHPALQKKKKASKKKKKLASQVRHENSAKDSSSATS